ncbi:MAG: hypothetical protein OXC54_11155 [Rhodospirillaceae bacterium]|nr:hypothetical protein [Rhodospirillaceae bacterium]
MARTEATHAQDGWPHDDQQNDVTDAERALTVPLQAGRERHLRFALSSPL